MKYALTAPRVCKENLTKVFFRFYLASLLWIILVGKVLVAQNITFQDFKNIEYIHYHMETGEISGRSAYAYKIPKDNDNFVEIIANYNEAGEKYSEIKTLYDQATLRLISIEIDDLKHGNKLSAQRRSEDSFSAEYQEKDGKVLSHSGLLNSRTVFFEEIKFFVRSNIERLQKEELSLNVLFVMVPFQDDIPNSMQQIAMKAKYEKIKTIQTSSGVQKVLAISVTPGSFWLSLFLPEEKTKLEYLVDPLPPHQIYQAVHDKYRYVLKK